MDEKESTVGPWESVPDVKDRYDGFGRMLRDEHGEK